MIIIMATIVIHFTAIVRTSTSYNSVEFQVVTKINKRKKIKEKIEIREYHFNRTVEHKYNILYKFLYNFFIFRSFEAFVLWI